MVRLPEPEKKETPKSDEKPKTPAKPKGEKNANTTPKKKTDNPVK